MRALGKYFIVGVLLSLTACDTPLVEEGYASLGEKSVNGADVFLATLLETKKTVRRYAFLTERAFETAELIVHFQKSVNYTSAELRLIEAQLRGLDPEEGGVLNPEFVFRQSLGAAAVETTGGWVGRSGKPTVLLFLFDSDMSVLFWERLHEQMLLFPKERDYCAQVLSERIIQRRKEPAAGPILFGNRRVPYPNGERIRQLFYDEEVFSERPPAFPVRSVPGDVQFLFEKLSSEVPAYRSLLKTAMGHDLIREFVLERARVIVVYNAELFLNYSLVLPEYRTMARDLVQYALRRSAADSDGNRSGEIAYIERSFLPIGEAMEREEQSNFRFFGIFPLNIILLQFVLLLLMFLLSRWPHERAPLEMKASGNREFLEHIRALGGKIALTGNARAARDVLLGYGAMKKNRRDTQGK